MKYLIIAVSIAVSLSSGLYASEDMSNKISAIKSEAKALHMQLSKLPVSHLGVIKKQMKEDETPILWMIYNYKDQKQFLNYRLCKKENGDIEKIQNTLKKIKDIVAQQKNG